MQQRREIFNFSKKCGRVSRNKIPEKPGRFFRSRVHGNRGDPSSGRESKNLEFSRELSSRLIATRTNKPFRVVSWSRWTETGARSLSSEFFDVEFRLEIRPSVRPFKFYRTLVRARSLSLSPSLVFSQYAVYVNTNSRAYVKKDGSRVSIAGRRIPRTVFNLKTRTQRVRGRARKLHGFRCGRKARAFS